MTNSMNGDLFVIDNDGIQYQLMQLIGGGVEGDVWKVWNRSDGNVYALKFYTRSKLSLRDFRKHYRFLFLIQHPLIVRFDKYWYGPTLHSVQLPLNPPECGHLLMQYIEGPQLEKQMIQNSQNSQILWDLMEIIDYLNRKIKICHGDLETDNIIICNGRPMVFDFGFSCQIKKKPYYDRQSLGLIALSLIVLNDQKMRQFESMIDWKNLKNQVLTKKEIQSALNHSEIDLNRQQLKMIQSFFDGSSFHRIRRLIKKNWRNT